MEDEWIEYYSKKSNLENYFETDNKKNLTYGFVKRKLCFWIKYYKVLKKKDSKYYNFYYGNKLDPDVLAFDHLSDYEKKIINN